MNVPVTKERLLEIVSAFEGRRLVVAGDYVLDRFIYGHPKRVSREAPVLILRFWKEESLPGGAGNTAANVASLSGVPLPVGVLGDDEAGKTLREIFSARGIATDGLLSSRDYRTPTKTRVLGGGPHSIKQQIVRFDREDVLPRNKDLEKALADSLRRAARGADGAILSDYGYGSVSPAAVVLLRKELSSGSITVDSRHNLPAYTGVDAATPNEEELEEAAGETLEDSIPKLEAAGTALRHRMGCGTLLVTRGSRGMALFDGGGPPVLLPVHGTDQVADVTGAGDTVLATFSLAFAAGASPFEAALLANFAGGVVVMRMGTAAVSPEDLRRAIESDRTLVS